MARQFGVDISIGRADIENTRGWVEVVIVGAPVAVDSALALARRSGVELKLADEGLPSLAAA
jgi:hypothetical protein